MNSYKIGQPVIAYDNEDEESDPVFGHITKFYGKKKIDLESFYLIEWADGESDMYTKERVKQFVDIYKKIAKETNS